MNIKELTKNEYKHAKKSNDFPIEAWNWSDEFWKHWQEVHAAQYKKMPYLQKYVVNSVIESTKGDSIFWGLVETWWNSKEEPAKMEQSPEAKAFNDPYFREHIEGAFGAWLEEKQIK